MRFFTGGVNHESNTFSPIQADMQRFHDMHYARGQALIDEHTGTRTVIGGFIDAANDLGIELAPTIHSFAMPSDAVTLEAWDAQMRDTIADLKAALDSGPIDGLLLGLHGAMVIGPDGERIEDGEGEYLRMVRDIVGPEMPIAMELDLHANISQKSVDLVDILVGYDTYPHIDVYDRAIELTHLLAKIVSGDVQPTAAFRAIPVLANLPAQYSGTPQMIDWLALCHEIESRPGALTATITCGFPYADIPDTGMAAYVATDDNPELAEHCVRELAQFAWDRRHDFQATPRPISEAVSYAMNAAGPILLTDVADNPGAGSSCDGTEVLRELIAQNARSAVVALMFDPETAAQAADAGIGATISARIGGKVDNLHGAPVETGAYVKKLVDGFFINEGPLGTGTTSNLGLTAVLEIGGRGGIEVVCTSLRRAANDANCLRSVGIEPTKCQIVVIKSSVHYRADFTPLVKEIIEVDAPGLSTSNWSRFDFRHLRRPIFPLDPDMTWEA